MKYIRIEIDHRNIINQLRSLRMELDFDKRLAMIIPGGRIDSGTMRQVCQSEDDEELVELLRRSNAFDGDGFETALEDAKNIGSLDPFAELLSHQRQRILRKFAYLSPVSPFPIIYYIERKSLEVRNLRLLVRGKAIGLDEKVLESHMDF